MGGTRSSSTEDHAPGPEGGQAGAGVSPPEPLPDHRLLAAVYAAASGRMSREETAQALHLNEAGLAKGTSRSHAAAWALWLTFLNSRSTSSSRSSEGGTEDADPFLLSYTPQEVGAIFVLWASWLRESQQESSARISSLTTNLKSNWITANLANRLETGRNADESRRANKTFRPSAAEVRAALTKKRATQIFPTADGMISGLRQAHFKDLLPTSHLAASLDAMGTYLGVRTTLETAQRGCQWFHKKDNHAILTRDVRFQWGLGEPDEDGTFESVEELIGAQVKGKLRGNGSLADLEANLHRIAQIKLDFLTSKTGTALPNFIISRRTEEEKDILEDMGRWVCLSDTRDDDPFLTRYAVPRNGGEKKGRRITPKEGTALVKLSARKAGLPEVHFALGSLRPAGTTAASRGGASTDEIRALTGHAKNSQVVNTHYNYDRPSTHGGRGEAVGTSVHREGGAFTIGDLLRIMPLRGRGPGNTQPAPEEKGEEEAAPGQPRRRATGGKRARTTATRAKGTTTEAPRAGNTGGGTKSSRSGRQLKAPRVLSYDGLALPREC